MVQQGARSASPWRKKSSVTRLALVAEGEELARSFLQATLPGGGFRTVEAQSGAEVIEQLTLLEPDVVLLGRDLTDTRGVELTRRLRDRVNAPIFMIAARASEDEKVAALEAGANDYITQPFSARLLLARIGVWLRPAGGKDGPDASGILQLDDLRVDRSRRRVYVGDSQVHLTPIEYKLLVLLMRNAGKILDYRQILETVWGPGHAEQVQYLHVYMGHLRRKLEDDRARPKRLRTESGIGYGLFAR